MAIWVPTRPNTTDRWADVPGFLQDNWETYGSATSAEHGNLGHATASGTHVLCGTAGTCFYGTTTEIDALTSPPCGALAYDQTLGWMKRYWPNAWYQTTLSADGWSRARWYLDADYISFGAVDGGTETQGLSFTGKTYDSASEWKSTVGNFVASAAGNYLIICQATVYASGDIGQYPANTLEIWKDHWEATCASIAKSVHYSDSTEVAQNDCVKIMTISQLAQGDKVSFWFTKTITDDAIVSGSDCTYFVIHRMGNSCL